VLTCNLTEAHKQAQAEAGYYKPLEQQEDESEQRHNSTISALPPYTSALEPVSHLANRTLRSSSTVTDLTTLFANIATKRRGSDDSLKTAYAADDTVPESAYRSRLGHKPGLVAQRTSITASVPINNSLDEADTISTITDH
jgi:hypothetical protein